VCAYGTNYCFKDLTLGFIVVHRAYGPDASWRAFKAVQFLQQYCPPKKKGF